MPLQRFELVLCFHVTWIGPLNFNVWIFPLFSSLFSCLVQRKFCICIFSIFFIIFSLVYLFVFFGHSEDSEYSGCFENSSPAFPNPLNRHAIPVYCCARSMSRIKFKSRKAALLSALAIIQVSFFRCWWHFGIFYFVLATVNQICAHVFTGGQMSLDTVSVTMTSFSLLMQLEWELGNSTPNK